MKTSSSRMLRRPPRLLPVRSCASLRARLGERSSHRRPRAGFALASLLLALCAVGASAQPAALSDARLEEITPARLEADVALARALVYAFEPAPDVIRTFAVEDLALLGDPRALEPLGHLTLDPSPDVQTAAVRALGRFDHPRALELLAELVERSPRPLPLKLEALAALRYQRSTRARTLLLRLSNARNVEPPLREAAQSLLSSWDPPAVSPRP